MLYIVIFGVIQFRKVFCTGLPVPRRLINRKVSAILAAPVTFFASSLWQSIPHVSVVRAKAVLVERDSVIE